MASLISTEPMTQWQSGAGYKRAGKLWLRFRPVATFDKIYPSKFNFGLILCYATSDLVEDGFPKVVLVRFLPLLCRPSESENLTRFILTLCLCFSVHRDPYQRWTSVK